MSVWKVFFLSSMGRAIDKASDASSTSTATSGSDVQVEAPRSNRSACIEASVAVQLPAHRLDSLVSTLIASTHCAMALGTFGLSAR